MALVVLVRHGRTAANVDGILAGWTPGVGLDPTGQEQAARLAARLSATPVVAVVTSPLERCVQTADVITAGRATERVTQRHTDDRLGECRYGAWTGRRIADLAKEPLWRDVQERPSTVTFPPHDDYLAESMQAMQRRAVAAVADWDSRVQAEHGPGAVWVAVSHGDVLKAILADALGTDLDRFQRIVIDPASVSIVRHSDRRPFVLRVNDISADPIELSTVAARAGADDAGDGVIGGGAGTV